MFRVFKEPTIPPTNASRWHNLHHGISANLYTSYFVKEFLDKQLNFSIVLGYHNVAWLENVVFMLIVILVFCWLYRIIDRKDEIPMTIIVFLSIMLVSSFSNELEVLFYGNAADYLKIVNSFNVDLITPVKMRVLFVETSWIVNIADALITLSTICLFWSAVFFLSKYFWKSRKFCWLVVLLLFAGVVISFPFFYSPPWVYEAEQKLLEIQEKPKRPEIREEKDSMWEFKNLDVNSLDFNHTIVK
jgi:lipoprotein signal peptidase